VDEAPCPRKSGADHPEGIGQRCRLVVPHPVVEGTAVQEKDRRTGPLVETEELAAVHVD
jgi:hypothetical protein